MVFPDHRELIRDIAVRHPRIRLLVNHLGVLPFDTLPDAASNVEALLGLARHLNEAVKANGVPSRATDAFPSQSTHEFLKRTLATFGPDRFFRGTDITRLRCSWTECVQMFAENLPWPTGNDLELVMGGGVANWIGWK